MMNTANPTEYRPGVVVLYCRNCVDANVRQIDSFRTLESFEVRQIVMPCSSKIDERLLLKLIENGADAVLVVACADHACKFLVGSLRAEKRIQQVRLILEEIGLGPERVSFIRRARLSAAGLLELAADRAMRVRSLGPNPAKAKAPVSSAAYEIAAG
jgi:F420-non-reducing hydrogenase iron-sulfur subunit